MNKDNKDDDDFKETVILYIAIAVGMIVIFALGKALGVPELQGVW